MSGKGKGAGVGKGKTPIRRRQVKAQRKPLDGVRNPTIRRLARRGGVKRLALSTNDTARAVLSQFLKKVLADAVAVVSSRRQNTVTSDDILYALRASGRTMYT